MSRYSYLIFCLLRSLFRSVESCTIRRVFEASSNWSHSPSQKCKSSSVPWANRYAIFTCRELRWNWFSSFFCISRLTRKAILWSLLCRFIFLWKRNKSVIARRLIATLFYVKRRIFAKKSLHQTYNYIFLKYSAMWSGINCKLRQF